MSADIFMRPESKSSYTDLGNGVIKIDLSESLTGGAATNDIIHLSLSPTSTFGATQKGGGDNEGDADTTEYFNRIAQSIVKKIGKQQGGGDHDNKKSDELTSETLNFIMNGGSTTEKSDEMDEDTITMDMLVGGKASKTDKGKKSNKKTFNFAQLKRQLSLAAHMTPTSSEIDTEKEISDFFDKTEEGEIKKMTAEEIMSDDESLTSSEDEDNEFADIFTESSFNQDELKELTKEELRDIPVDPEVSDSLVSPYDSDKKIDDLMKQAKAKRVRRSVQLSEPETSTISSNDLSLNANEHDVSESISSPRLISYRKVNTARSRRGL